MGALAVSRAFGDRYFKAPLNEAKKDFVTADPYCICEEFQVCVDSSGEPK
jgi:hypothetical protein